MTPSSFPRSGASGISRAIQLGDNALKGKPLAVIGAALGRYRGVWAHDEIGPRVVEEIKLSVPMATLDGKHPREHAQLAADVRDVVARLAAEVG